MTAQECLRGRRSVRRYSDKPLARETLEAAFELTRFAPSWRNTQTARYTVVMGENKQKLIDAALGMNPRNVQIAEQAQAVIVVSTVHGLAGFRDDGGFATPKEDRWEVFDAGVATQQLCLALYAEGVGSVIMGLFDEEGVKSAVPLPDGEIVSVLVAAGYPADEPRCAPKKETAELVRYM